MHHQRGGAASHWPRRSVCHASPLAVSGRSRHPFRLSSAALRRSWPGDHAGGRSSGRKDRGHTPAVWRFRDWAPPRQHARSMSSTAGAGLSDGSNPAGTIAASSTTSIRNCCRTTALNSCRLSTPSLRRKRRSPRSRAHPLQGRLHRSAPGCQLTQPARAHGGAQVTMRFRSVPRGRFRRRRGRLSRSYRRRGLSASPRCHRCGGSISDIRPSPCASPPALDDRIRHFSCRAEAGFRRTPSCGAARASSAAAPTPMKGFFCPNRSYSSAADAAPSALAPLRAPPALTSGCAG